MEFPSAMCAVPLADSVSIGTPQTVPDGLNAIETSARLRIRSSAQRASMSWRRPASSPSVATSSPPANTRATGEGSGPCPMNNRSASITTVPSLETSTGAVPASMSGGAM